MGVWKRTLKPDTVSLEVTPFSGFGQVGAHAFAAAADRYGRFIDMPVEL